jgi:hypothetical protein
MQFTLILVAIVVTTTHSYPAEMMSSSSSSYSPSFRSNDVVQSPPQSRPVQQFFKKILEVLRPTTTTTTEAPRLTLHIQHQLSPYLHQTEFQEIPNYVDLSTYLLESLSTNNSAVAFAFMAKEKITPTSAPESSKKLDDEKSKLRNGNYSVISFIVPHNDDHENVGKSGENKTRGAIEELINFLRRPWTRVDEPSDTEYSQFPPVIEYFTQRLQAYFSVYKYPDESRFNNTIVILIPENQKKTGNETQGTKFVNDEIEVTSEFESTFMTTNDNEFETTTTKATQFELGEMSTDKVIEME